MSRSNAFFPFTLAKLYAVRCVIWPFLFLAVRNSVHHLSHGQDLKKFTALLSFIERKRCRALRYGASLWRGSFLSFNEEAVRSGFTTFKPFSLDRVSRVLRKGWSAGDFVCLAIAVR